MSGGDYAFRLRFTRSPRNAINVKETELQLPTAEPGHELVLRARDRGAQLETSEILVLHGAGWPTAEEAKRQGSLYADILARAYARLRLGADFGARAARAWITEAGLEHFTKQAGKPTMNDVHGLMVYDRSSNPSLLFVSMKGDMTVGTPTERFLSVFGTALSRPREISEQERVALELFNASFFQKSWDGRFLLLMMALEALIEQGPQPEKVIAIVRGFLREVEADNDLCKREKDYLKSRIGGLQKESFRQAGCRLIREKLGDRHYHGMPAEDFFEICYDIRSSIAHGEAPLPTTDQVNSVGAPLEVMVSHLLANDLLDVGPQQEGR